MNDQRTVNSPRPTGNKARVRRYRANHRRIDYVPSPDAWTIIEHHLKIGTDPCLAGVIDYLIRSGHQAVITGNGGRDATTPGLSTSKSVRTMWEGTPVGRDTLWPGYQWRCRACLEQTIPGKDTVSKSMSKMIEHRQRRNLACAVDAQDDPAHTEHHQAEWARYIAATRYSRGTARSKELAQAKGEVIPPEPNQSLHDTLTVPVEASFERSRLLLSSGPNVAAIGIGASDAIQARNSLEKMLAHQLAATHAVVMEQIGQVHIRDEAPASAKRLTAIARCLEAYQHGLLTLKKLRPSGNQRILVQYVNVTEGG